MIPFLSSCDAGAGNRNVLALFAVRLSVTVGGSVNLHVKRPIKIPFPSLLTHSTLGWLGRAKHRRRTRISPEKHFEDESKMKTFRHRDGERAD
jgi:hypothetical protein